MAEVVLEAVGKEVEGEVEGADEEGAEMAPRQPPIGKKSNPG